MNETVAPDVIPGVDVDGDSSNPTVESAVTETALQSEEAKGSGELADGSEKSGDDGVPYGVRKRIDKLTWEREEARRQEAHWKALAMQGQQQQQPAQQVQAPVSSEPKPDNFNTYEEFQAALIEYKAAQVVESRLSQRQVIDETARRQAELDNSFRRQCDAVKSEYPDFAIAFKQPHEGGPVVNDVMAIAIKESDVGAKVLYHLAKNPALSERIAGMPPTTALREIGRIEARYVSAPANSPPKKQVTQAPPPIKTVSGSGSSSLSGEVDYEKMTPEEFAEYRNSRR